MPTTDKTAPAPPDLIRDSRDVCAAAQNKAGIGTGISSAPEHEGDAANTYYPECACAEILAFGQRQYERGRAETTEQLREKVFAVWFDIPCSASRADHGDGSCDCEETEQRLAAAFDPKGGGNG